MSGSLPRGFNLDDFPGPFREKIEAALVKEKAAQRPHAPKATAVAPQSAPGPRRRRVVAVVKEAAPAPRSPGTGPRPVARIRAAVEAHPWHALGWVTGFWLSVLAGLLFAMPRVAPDGWRLQPSAAAEIAAWLVVVTHLSRWLLAPAVVASGLAGARWGGRSLQAAARVALVLLAAGVAWALVLR